MPAEFRASGERIDRIERWILASARHRLGQSDEFSQDLATWSLTDLQALWVDANALARVMRDRSIGGFRLAAPDGSSTRIVYSRAQFQSLQRLACIAGGYLDPSGATMPVGSMPRDCVEAVPLAQLNPAVAEVALWFGRERLRRGDDNLFWRRSALLHSDVAMRDNPRSVPTGTLSLPVGPRRIRTELLDGRRMTITLGGIHWSLAETLLGFVTPPGSPRPAPDRDEMVRAWYQATTMWMQGHEQRDLQHLLAGLALFPNDAMLLFLSGCEHEAYASPAIQVPLAGTRNTRPVRSSREELELATADFRSSLDAAGAPAEVLVHLGHVQLLLGDSQDAVSTLNRTYEELASDTQRFLRDMFLGQAHERTAATEEARAAYERARVLFPRAQSPLLALSQLQRRADNYEPARQAMEQLWAVIAETDDDDPWWAYSTSHTTQADLLVEAAWRLAE